MGVHVEQRSNRTENSQQAEVQWQQNIDGRNWWCGEMRSEDAGVWGERVVQMGASVSSRPNHWAERFEEAVHQYHGYEHQAVRKFNFRYHE